MTMCPNSKHACLCQPQEGVMCPYGPTPKDWPGVAEYIDAERATPTLKPCPFCGSAEIAHHTFFEDDSRDFVMCSSCGVYAQRNDCDAEPVEVWNRRTSASIGEDGLPELPILPKQLLDLIGNYGLSYADGIGDVDRLRRWTQLIAGIKEYARDALAAARIYQRKVDEKIIARKEAEIADLRAQLARQSQGAPRTPTREMLIAGMHHFHDKPEPATRAERVYRDMVDAAPPLSSEQQAAECVGCEGMPSTENNPCAVCGKAAQAKKGANQCRMN